MLQNRNELPMIAASSYGSSVMTLGNNVGFGIGNSIGQWNEHKTDNDYYEQRIKGIQAGIPARVPATPTLTTPAKPQEKTMPKRRIVQVFIADTDENVPLDQCLLYKGEQKLTDATDQELFFEIEIKSVIDRHNEARGKIINKTVKERTEYLEPVKLRDLKMTVVTVAEFA